MNKRQYFVVGASYGGNNPQQERFVRDGIWALGWTKEDHPFQFETCLKMKPGDFIAIKRRNGKGASTITVLARGIIKGIIPEAIENGRFVCTVEWFEKDLEEKVPLKHRDTLASAAGPFYLNDEDDYAWLTQVFGL